MKSTQMSLQRDSIIEFLSSNSANQKRFKFITPDFGARPLDQFREKFSDSFIFTGIAEQLSADLAFGISKAGQLPIVYGMSPFISARAFEQYKVLFGQTNLPICILPVGVGLGYDHNTCSHYSLEDIALYTSVNDMTVLTPCDTNRSVLAIHNWLDNPYKLALRLERQPMPLDIFQEFENVTEIKGVGVLIGNALDHLLISWGKLGVELANSSVSKNCSVLLVEEISTSSFNSLQFLVNYQSVEVIEESYVNTGIYPFICQALNNTNVRINSVHIKSDIKDIRAHRSSLWQYFGLKA